MAENVGSRSWSALARDRQVVAWSFYDWANSAFATTVIAGFFQIFFKQYWGAGVDPQVSTYYLGWANSLAAAGLAILSPWLGAVADRGSKKKAMLTGFTFLGVVTTAALSLVARGDWLMASVLYVIASIGFAGSNVFYDALIVSVAKPRELGAVSALGFSLGYLGGGVLFAVNVLMTLKPALFGLRDAAHAVQVSFITVGVWWALFTIPLALFVREERKPSPDFARLAREGFAQVVTTFREIRALRNVALFLAAYFFYIDGVNTMVRMAVDYGLALGFPKESLIIALLMVQFIGFPAAIGFVKLTEKIGAKAGLFLAIVIYTLVTIYGYFMTTPRDFYVLAAVIGLAQGGIQSLSRSVFAAMTPAGKAGEFFGFFNMLGKFSSMVGPMLVGLTAVAFDSSRLSILSLILLFLAGGALLSFVKIDDRATGTG